MSSPRLVPAVALATAALVLPASAAAKITPISGQPSPDPAYGTHLVDGNPVVNMTADDIFAPGEDINVMFPFSDDGADETGAPLTFDGGTGLLSRTDDNDLSILTTTRQFGQSNSGYTSNAVSAGGSGFYQLRAGSQLVCGTSVGLRLDMSSVAQPQFNKSYDFTIPTGVRGAFRRNPSYDVGQVVTDGGTIQSKVDVTGQGGKIRGLRLHINSLEHRFSTYWLELKLVAPSGKKITLMSRQGSLDANQGARPKVLTNVTFSDTSVNGNVPKDAAEAQAAAYTDIVMAPKEPLSLLDGENVDGTWKLEVHDIPGPLENRSSRARSYSFTANEMAQVGDWQLDTASALCNGTPQAWFGGDAGPLVLNPAGGTLDASASHDPSLNGSIATYQWDLDGNTGNGFEVSTTSPTVPYGAVTAAPYTRDIKLRVVDNQGNTSDVVTRTAIFSNKPVIGGVVLSPTTPVAGQQVSLTASATDSDVGDTLSYAWDLDGDGAYELSGPAVQKSWAMSGPQVIRLKVTDSRGATSYSWQTITIANTNPIARAVYSPVPAVINQTVTLSGATSTDADGTIASYAWDLDGNGTTTDVVSATPTTTTTFDSPGEHIVRLVVTDNTGGTDEVQLSVWVAAPPVGVIDASPASPLVGETVTFSAAQSYDADAGGSISKYEWDLDGNGSYEVSGAAAVTATKAYPNPGTISVRLRLTDNDGAASITPFSLVVRSPTSGGGGGGGGGTSPTPTPKPSATPTPSPGVTVPPVTVPGSTPITNAVPQDRTQTEGTNWWDTNDETEEPGKELDGFAAAMNASAKQPGKKAYKKGVAVSLKANAAGKIAVKATIDGKLAKKLGISTKAKVLSIGAGTLELKKGGTGKFYVRFNKKYAAKVKKAKALTVMLRGLVTSADGTKLALSRKVTIVK